MKKLRILGLALACLGVVLLCLIISEESVGTGTAVVSGQTAAEPAGNDRGVSRNSGLDHVSGVTAGNGSKAAPDSLAEDDTRPYFKRVGSAVVTPDGRQYPLRIYHTMSLPDDPSASQPWVFSANIDGAWDTPHGSNPTLLAIVDTGFDLQHEEFQGRWHANTGETADNGIDDDGNGLVDDRRGWDFASDDDDVQAQAQGRHGTFVAGVAAASGDNGKGIAGVDWGTTILPIQGLDEDGEGYNSDVANGIIYAVDQGADVISLSLGSELPDSVVRQAVDYAISEGSIVVAAAGNDGCDCMVYPANYPETVAVGATNSSNQLASFSSYGANLDVVAPGVNLYTTDWQAADPTSAYAGGISGTSLATPVISGLLTRLKSLQPSATPLQLIANLTENSDRLNLGSSTPRSDTLGYGLVDGGAATVRAVTTHQPSTMHLFSPLSLGLGLSPGSPAEKAAGTAEAYRCSSGRPGTTPVYGLSKANQEFFTVSPAEVGQAEAQGYTAELFGYSCLTLPGDTPASTQQGISLHKLNDLNGVY